MAIGTHSDNFYFQSGSIGLATNAGNYFFLHDLAQRYTKKMEIYMEANPIFAFEKKPSEPQVSSTGYSETAESTEVKHLRNIYISLNYLLYF